MATRSRNAGGGIAGAIKVDLQRLYGAWMELLFPRQLVGHSVLGKWRPETIPQKIGYRAWSVVGMCCVVFLYPLTLVGFATRYYAGKLDSTATRLGIVGVAGVSVLGWGILTVVARFQLSTEGFLAVLVASVVATLSAALAVAFSKVGGRATTVALGYPFAVTALFLPPVVAAFYHPTLADMVFTRSEELAIFVLDEILYVGGVNDRIRDAFVLDEVGTALMWTALSFLIGWFFGLLVSLANVVRPSD